MVNLLDDSTRRIDYDALVIAGINRAGTTRIDELADSRREVHAIRTCVASRRANNATYEGRRPGI